MCFNFFFPKNIRFFLFENRTFQKWLSTMVTKEITPPSEKMCRLNGYRELSTGCHLTVNNFIFFKSTLLND